MKFYEVRQKNTTVGFFKKRKLAEKYVELFNTKVEVSPLEIVEREFLTKKDLEK